MKMRDNYPPDLRSEMLENSRSDHRCLIYYSLTIFKINMETNTHEPHHDKSQANSLAS